MSHNESDEKNKTESSKTDEKSPVEKELDNLKAKLRKEIEAEEKKDAKDPEQKAFGKNAKKVLEVIAKNSTWKSMGVSDLLPQSKDAYMQEVADKLGIEMKGKKKAAKITKNDAIIAMARSYVALQQLEAESAKAAPKPKEKVPASPPTAQ